MIIYFNDIKFSEIDVLNLRSNERYLQKLFEFFLVIKFLWNGFSKIDVKTFFNERRRVEGRLSAR